MPTNSNCKGLPMSLAVATQFLLLVHKQSQSTVRKGKSLGWIPNPRTKINFFNNEVYTSFYPENIRPYAHNKKSFNKAFHAEARKQYTHHNTMLKAGKKVDQLMNIKDASSFGYLLRAEHVAKPHDSETARFNLERIEGISSTLKNLKAEVTTDLNGTVNSKGRIKPGRKTVHDFDEGVLTKIKTMRENIEKTKTELVKFGNRVASVFKFKFAGHKRKLRSKK